MKNRLIGKDPEAGKGWRQEEKGMTEDEMVGWHHRLSGHLSLSKLQGIVKDREAWSAAIHGVAKSWTWLRDWTTTSLLSGYLVDFTDLFLENTTNVRKFWHTWIMAESPIQRWFLKRTSVSRFKVARLRAALRLAAHCEHSPSWTPLTTHLSDSLLKQRNLSSPEFQVL